jgi:hypothetical protein
MDKKEELLNTIMGCSLCGYYTCNRRDYVRHLETKKCKMRHAKENAKVNSSQIKELAVCPIALDEYKKEAAQVSKELPLVKQNEQIIKDEVSISSITTYEDSSDSSDSSDDEDYEDDEIYENIYTSPLKFVNGWQSMTHFIFAFIGFIRDSIF